MFLYRRVDRKLGSWLGFKILIFGCESGHDKIIDLNRYMNPMTRDQNKRKGYNLVHKRR